MNIFQFKDLPQITNCKLKQDNDVINTVIFFKMYYLHKYIQLDYEYITLPIT